MTPIEHRVRDSYPDEVPYVPAEQIMPPPDEPTLDLRQVLQTVWRRKHVVIACMVVCTTLAFLAVNQATPLYTAQAEVVMEKQQERSLNFVEVLQGTGYDHTTPRTEAAVITSREMAERVIERLGLMQHPLFNPTIPDPNRREPAFDVKAAVKSLIPPWLMEEWRRARQGDDERRPLTPEEREARLRQNAIELYIGSVDAQSSDLSRVLRIQFVSPDGDLSARIANAAAVAYVDQTVQRKFEAVSRATQWLDRQAGDLKAALQESRKALEAHRRQIGFINLERSGSLLAEQLGQLSTELVRARTARAEAEARFQQVQKLLESDEGIESATTVLDSPLIQRLREQEATVSRELAELRTQLRDGHPKMQLKIGEFEDLQQRIRREVAKLAVNLANELEIAQVRELNLTEEVSNIQLSIQEQNEQLVELRSLESEVATNEEIYNTVLSRFKETGVQEEEFTQPDARIISPAVAPGRPSYPKKGLILAMALVFSAGFGIVLVFIIEHMDAGFRSLPQLEALTGAPALGIVPKVTGMGRRDELPHELMLRQPSSVYGEAIRAIRTSLMLSSAPRVPRTIVVASSIPGEGKTTVALSLARAAAKAGQRAIIVDCDMRQPAMHRAMRVPNLQGLSEYLRGEVSLEDVIDIDPTAGVHFVTAGHDPRNPADALGSERMRRLIERLREAYDLVVFDSPPVLAVSDILMMLSRVDKTMFLVRWGSTRREAVVAAVRLLIDAHADLAGLVLTHVDTRRHSGYSYGGYKYYYGAYQKYYRT